MKIPKGYKVPKRKAEMFYRQVKLNVYKVRDIRKLHADGISTKELALKYEVTPRTILSVVNHETWNTVQCG